MNIREYLEATATTHRVRNTLTHPFHFSARSGAHFYARFSRKWQLMYLDGPRTRYAPDWLAVYTGKRDWQEPLMRWLEENGGFNTNMPAIECHGSPVSEIMAAVTRYGHVSITRKDSTEPATISCINGKSGVIADVQYGFLDDFLQLRQLRGWLANNATYVARSTRPKLRGTLGEWLDEKAENGIFDIDMTDQEVPVYLRNSDLEDAPNFPGWRYYTPDGELRGAIERGYAMAGKKLDSYAGGAIERMVYSRITTTQPVRMDVTRTLAWTRGSYGDERSCFWTSATNSRNMLQNAGAFALRFYNERGRGVGRCWALPRGNAIAIFNAYGRYQLHEIAAILEHATGHEARSLRYDYANIYINNETSFGFNYPSVTARLNVDLNSSAPTLYRQVVACRDCNSLINPTGAEPIPTDNRCPECSARREARLQAAEQQRIERERQEADAAGTFNEALAANVPAATRSRNLADMNFEFNVRGMNEFNHAIQEVGEAMARNYAATIADAIAPQVAAAIAEENQE